MLREFALPGTTAQYAPDRTCDIKHISIELDIDIEHRRIAGVCSITLAPIAKPLRWIRLDAVELHISAVRVADTELTFEHDGAILRIDVGDPAPADKSLTLDIHYSGQPRRGLYFVGPDDGYPDKPVQVWSQGQDVDSRYWFPCFDSPHEKATSELRVTVPKNFFALSNGTLVADTHAAQRRTLHWKFDTPHSCYLITLAAGEFSEIHDRWDDVDIAYYVTPGREQDAQRTLGRTSEMLDLFSSRFGVKYPYEKYAQIFVADFIFGGMENTTATTLTDVVLLDERAALDYDVDDLVAHELAHQWFGDLLTCRDWGQGWLNEGFATYAEYIWHEHADGRDSAALDLERWGERYFSEDAGRYRRTVATNVYDEPIDIFDHHLYDKGGRILHMLRRELGDDAFWKAIGHYLSKHRGGVVETRDLARAVEDATGRVLDWFFDQWITKGAGHPELELTYSWDPERRIAGFKVVQSQKLEGGTPVFRLRTHVRLRVDNIDRDIEVEIREPEQTFYFPSRSAPSHAIFDPGKHLLAKVTTTKPISLWLTELASAHEAIDRIYAARELAKLGGPAAVRALVHALNNDPFWAVRGAAATSLGQLTTDDARDALIGALATTEHPKARRAVVRALGEFKRDAKAAAALTQRINSGDASYFVEAEACLALGKTRSPHAVDVLTAAAKRDSFTDVIRQHCYRGLAETRDERAVPLLMSGTEYGGPSHGRRAAMSALAHLAAGGQNRLSRRVRERAEELLNDPDFRVQGAAIESLARLADPAAIPALQLVVSRNLDARLRRRAREVIRDIREGTSREKELRLLRDDVDSLRAQVLTLRERLDQLDTTQANRTNTGVAVQEQRHKRHKKRKKHIEANANKPRANGKNKNKKKSLKKKTSKMKSKSRAKPYAP